MSSIQSILDRLSRSGSGSNPRFIEDHFAKVGYSESKHGADPFLWAEAQIAPTMSPLTSGTQQIGMNARIYVPADVERGLRCSLCESGENTFQ